MDVQIQSSRIIPPQHEHETLPREVPLTIFDRFAPNMHVPVVWAFAAPTPSNETLIDCLYKTLRYFPTLTAELNQSQVNKRPCLIMDGLGGGALLVAATVNSKLSDHLPLEPTHEFINLHPSVKDPVHLFQVQISRFKDEGVVISTTAHHRVADGPSMSLFFTTWASMVRGEPINRFPVYDLSWLKPRYPPRCEFNHWKKEFVPIHPYQNEFIVEYVNVDPNEITNILLRYPNEFITKLKAEVKNIYTTFETMLGYIWRKITIARGLKDEENTMIRFTVNGRRRVKPSVPNEFFGNLIVNAYPESNVKQLIASGIAGAARLIHEAVIKADHNYIQSFIDFEELYGDENLMPIYDTFGNVLSPNLEASSWLGFSFEEVDFGSGVGPSTFLPTWIPEEGLVILLPLLGQRGGINVVVTMLVKHAELLKKISHSVN